MKRAKIILIENKSGHTNPMISGRRLVFKCTYMTVDSFDILSKQDPNVTVKYAKKSDLSYREKVSIDQDSPVFNAKFITQITEMHRLFIENKDYLKELEYLNKLSLIKDIIE